MALHVRLKVIGYLPCIAVTVAKLYGDFPRDVILTFLFPMYIILTE